MRKKTALRTPENPKASPHRPSGLIAKGQQPGESAQEGCALDNRSHRTARGLPERPIGRDPEPTSSLFFQPTARPANVGSLNFVPVFL
jgi:hypothetical protein